MWKILQIILMSFVAQCTEILTRLGFIMRIVYAGEVNTRALSTID